MDIVALAIQVYTEGIDQEQENDAAGFLRVHIEHDPNTVLLNKMQKGLIKPILETLGLNVETSSEKFTPAEGEPLAKHVH